MTQPPNRRRPPWIIGIAALLPITCAQAAADTRAAASGQAALPFVPPGTPMLLTRTLRRTLHDGKEVLTRRSYEIRFVPDGAGYRIDGTLVDVTVEVPEDLAGLAALERARRDDGLFPMRVYTAGVFTSKNAIRISDEVRKATETTMAELGTSRLAALDMLQAQAFVDQIRKRPAQSEWPQDLFRPATSYHSERREIPLPGGVKGSVLIDMEARTSGRSGLLSSFTRTVTTDLGGDVRQTHEIWTLAPGR